MCRLACWAPMDRGTFASVLGSERVPLHIASCTHYACMTRSLQECVMTSRSREGSTGRLALSLRVQLTPLRHSAQYYAVSSHQSASEMSNAPSQGLDEGDDGSMGRLLAADPAAVSETAFSATAAAAGDAFPPMATAAAAGDASPPSGGGMARPNSACPRYHAFAATNDAKTRGASAPTAASLRGGGAAAEVEGSSRTKGWHPSPSAVRSASSALMGGLRCAAEGGMIHQEH